MSKRPVRLRRRPSRVETRQLSEVLDFILDHEELVIEKYEAKKEEIKKAEEAAKKKAEEEKNQSFFVKKFTFGQLFLWIWLSQLPFGVLWFLFLYRLTH